METPNESKALSEREKQKKKQDEAMKRAAGHLPPERDEESGKLINPHNPEFITKVPWYLGESGPTLKHHADQKSNVDLSMSEADGLFARKHATQLLMKEQNQRVGYRKGACKNCGAMTHKEKDCVERPRSKKKAAVNSGMNIAHDEVVLNLNDYGKVGYSVKRDAWRGYDADEYINNIEKYKRIEAERRRIKKEEKAKKKLEESAKDVDKVEGKRKETTSERKNGDDSGSEIHDSDDSDFEEGGRRDEDDDDDDDEDDTGVSKKELLAADEQQRDFQGRMARQGGVGGNQMMVTARNLRIREDKPKYLRNLDLNSAHYDPKSRSMRANPTPGENPEDLDFAGDNFHRQTGDAVELAKAQVLAWEMEEHVNPAGSGDITGAGLDMIANPSAAALATKQYQEQKTELSKKKKQSLAEKYGDASASSTHFSAKQIDSATVSEGSATLDSRLRMGQTEVYREYEIDGSGKITQKNALDPTSSQMVSNSGGNVRPITSTKYEEDVLEGNHTSVWGSFFDVSSRQWGYACCWSTLRGSYCSGEAGKNAIKAASSGFSRLLDKRRETVTAGGQGRSQDASGSAPTGIDETTTNEAFRKAQKWQSEETKRKGLNQPRAAEAESEGVASLSPDMEGYYAKKLRVGDPMVKQEQSK